MKLFKAIGILLLVALIAAGSQSMAAKKYKPASIKSDDYSTLREAIEAAVAQGVHRIDIGDVTVMNTDCILKQHIPILGDMEFVGVGEHMSEIRCTFNPVGDIDLYSFEFGGDGVKTFTNCNFIVSVAPSPGTPNVFLVDTPPVLNNCAFGAGWNKQIVYR